MVSLFVNSFSVFLNSNVKVTRGEGKHTVEGFEKNSVEEVLSCRADTQENGRALQRAQQLYETGDVLVFASSVEGVKPADGAELNMDDGRTLYGSVDEVIGIDDSLLISL